MPYNEKTGQDLKKYYTIKEICQEFKMTETKLMWLIGRVYRNGSKKFTSNQYLELKSMKA